MHYSNTARFYHDGLPSVAAPSDERQNNWQDHSAIRGCGPCVIALTHQTCEDLQRPNSVVRSKPTFMNLQAITLSLVMCDIRNVNIYRDINGRGKYGN